MTCRGGIRASNLGEGAALANSDEVTEGNVTESGGDVGAEVLVALLETLVLRDEVEVVTADDACAVISCQLNTRQVKVQEAADKSANFARSSPGYSTTRNKKMSNQ